MNIFEKQKCCVCAKSPQILYKSQCVFKVNVKGVIKVFVYLAVVIKQSQMQFQMKKYKILKNHKEFVILVTKIIFIIKVQQKNKDLQWNTNSLLLTKFLGEEKRNIKIQQPLEIHEKQNIEKDILNVRSDAHLLNYSIREFVTQCQQGLKTEQIRNSIIRVLELCIAHHPNIGYCQGMNYIAIICLCLANEEGAFHIMNHLFNFAQIIHQMKKMENIDNKKQSIHVSFSNMEQTLKHLCIIWYKQDIYLQKEISIYPLDKELFKLIFNLFDENKSNLLDFREFLICLSTLFIGSFEEKFKMIFIAITSTVLQFNDFQALLLILIAQYIQITDEYQQFIQRIKRPSFSYFDRLNTLKDPFIVQIEILKKQKKPGIKKFNKQNRIQKE